MSQSVETCLSREVYQLVCEQGVVDSRAEDDCSGYLTYSQLLNLETIERLVQEEVTEEPLDFRRCVKTLAPLFSAVERYMRGLSSEQFASQYQHLLTWTSSTGICLRCFEYLKGGLQSSRLLSLLLSTAVLERALGDLYLTRGKQCPSLLRELLVTSELEALLGFGVVGFLRMLIGPPTSLNLRNLVWHGFPAPSEIPLQYCYVLLLVIVSLGELITTSMDVDTIPHRASVSFHQVEKITANFLASRSILPEVKVKQLCRNTQFILPQFLPVWEDAFDLYKENRFGESVTLVFPLLENGLRWMFAELNHCPDRVLTAESSVLYTTFDEILARHVQGKENKLLSRLGQPVVELLQDLMVYPEGPRFRDRLGHGEASFLDISQQQAEAVWLTALALIYTFTSPYQSHQQDEHAETVLSELDSYISAFHPVSLLCDQISSLVESLCTWLSNVHYSQDLTKMLSQDDGGKVLPMNTLYMELLPLVQQTALPFLQQIRHNTGAQLDERFLLPSGNVTPALNAVLKSVRISNLRKARSMTGQSPMTVLLESEDAGVGCSMEEIGLLRKTLSECLHISENVLQALKLRQQQLEAKQLRSRQRDTLKRLLSSLPCLSVGLRTVIVVTLSQLMFPGTGQNRVTIRFLKTMLQYCENVRTCTAGHKNNWLESVGLMMKFVRSIRKG